MPEALLSTDAHETADTRGHNHPRPTHAPPNANNCVHFRASQMTVVVHYAIGRATRYGESVPASQYRLGYIVCPATNHLLHCTGDGAHVPRLRNLNSHKVWDRIARLLLDIRLDIQTQSARCL